jgi:hypothetical protein
MFDWDYSPKGKIKLEWYYSSKGKTLNWSGITPQKANIKLEWAYSQKAKIKLE